MAWVRLVQGALGRPPDDAVQQLRLLQVLRAPAEASLDLARELLVHEVSRRRPSPRRARER
eukprot:11167302-Alexandrium_andersonii.AAC.1